MKMKKLISVSMMKANFLHLEQQLREIHQVPVDMLHIDVMDGSFVPSYSLFPDLIRSIRSCSLLPFDYHLMIESPSYKLKWFDIRKGDSVSVHYECEEETCLALDNIKELGAKAGIALKPLTSVEIIEPYLDKLDFVLILGLNPGIAGQTFIPETLDKVKHAKEFLHQKKKDHIKIEVDGKVCFDNAKIMSQNGADIFVAGTNTIFQNNLSISKACEKLRNEITTK